MPADVQSAATGTPVGIVYDEDGSVINALFGQGASDPSDCRDTGVMTVVDNFASDGSIVHALMLVNGLCATSAGQIEVLQYQMVRGFGRVLGLDWSQANEAMFADNAVTSDGLAGWPLMHPIERLCGSNGEPCMPNDNQLRPDDIAALNRFYPVTAQNVGSYSQKQITAQTTVSIQGTIGFKSGQGMQGVNVVARPLIPGTNTPDPRLHGHGSEWRIFSRQRRQSGQWIKRCTRKSAEPFRQRRPGARRLVRSERYSTASRSSNSRLRDQLRGHQSVVLGGIFCRPLCARAGCSFGHDAGIDSARTTCGLHRHAECDDCRFSHSQ